MFTFPDFCNYSPFPPRSAGKFLALALIMVPAVSASDAPEPAGPQLPPAPEGFAWIRIAELSDEFSGQSLDQAKWFSHHPYWSGRPPSKFHPGNVSVSNGLLHLRATSLVSSLDEVANPKEDIWVHSSCVTSRKRIARHGYYECRFKASALSMTSSFWLQGGGTEIDVVEQIGAPARKPKEARQMLMNTHLFVKRDGRKIDLATPSRWTMPTGAAEEFHTYGVWWRDDYHAWFYHNGNKVAEIKFAGPFREKMYLFLDTEVFTWAGLPAIASLNDPRKNCMQVDWVRSWKLEPVPE